MVKLRNEFKDAFIELAQYEAELNKNGVANAIAQYKDGDLSFFECVKHATDTGEVLSNAFIDKDGNEKGRLIVLNDNQLLTVEQQDDRPVVRGYDCSLESFLDFADYRLSEATFHQNIKFSQAKNEQELYKYQAHFFPSLIKGEFIDPPHALKKPNHEVMVAVSVDMATQFNGLNMESQRKRYLANQTSEYISDDIARCINNTVGQDCLTADNIFSMNMTDHVLGRIDNTPVFITAESLIPDTQTIRANLREKDYANYPFMNHPFDPELQINHKKAMIQYGLALPVFDENGMDVTVPEAEALGNVISTFVGIDKREEQATNVAHALVAIARLEQHSDDVKAQALISNGIPMTGQKMHEIAQASSTTEAVILAEEVLPRIAQQRINLDLQRMENEREAGVR